MAEPNYIPNIGLPGNPSTTNYDTIEDAKANIGPYGFVTAAAGGTPPSYPLNSVINLVGV
jgi:hypothetical protein